MNVCVITGEKIIGEMHDAAPVANGLCSKEANNRVVIPYWLFLANENRDIAMLLKGFDRLMIVLIVFKVIDFLSGLLLAIVFKNSKKTKNGRLSSGDGIKGLAKKVFILFLFELHISLIWYLILR